MLLASDARARMRNAGGMLTGGASNIRTLGTSRRSAANRNCVRLVQFAQEHLVRKYFLYVHAKAIRRILWQLLLMLLTEPNPLLVLPN
jgi:hypothetical protein